MVGGAGNDTYVVDNAGDVVSEAFNSGSDLVRSSITYTLGANLENLTLIGSTAINGTGNGLDNIIVGNTGNNMIKGGLGNDTLTGNVGQDGFVFDTALNASSNKDVITDFNVTDDTIYLENSIFAKLTTVGGLSITNFCSNVTGIASDADDFIVYNSTTGLLSYDADGNG